MNGLSFYNNHLGVTEDNIEEYFNSGIILDMYTSSAAVKYAIYENGDWYLESP